ncbi:trigger factor [Basilea psittacipulmonis]|uniref:Trigger factor n=1 Tax=Basilea psittacipulmonis DSM 24701 TaxID=1072685 RepID=A0A077DGB7_9BURK|nr:trigger factor [Basilea psittacipulmonis]AIL32517.1 trigger factor [Basilea psittacipulmonis DSM 24701]
MSMVETLNGLERQVKFSLTVGDVEKEVQKELKRVQRTAKIQGFRPGHAPLSILEKSHGPSIRYDVINHMAGQKMNEIAVAEKLNIAGVPSLEMDEAEEGKINLIAKFEVFPEVALPDFSAIELKRFVCDVTDEDVTRTIDVIRLQRAKYEKEDGRAAAKNDRVTLDFVGKIDGVEFPGGKADNFPFLLGNGQMLPEFEAAAEGLKAGESKTFDLHFPEDYHGKDVAGKTAQFTITIKEVAKQVLPELNSEFVKTLGQKDGNVDNFKVEVRKNLEREVKARVQNRTKSEVLNKTAETVEFELPKALVAQETQARLQAAKADLKARGVPDVDKVNLPAELFEEDAKRRVKLGLLLRELVEKEKLNPKPEQVRAYIEDLSQSFEKPQEVVTYYLTDANRRAEVENLVLEQNVVDFILSKAKVSEEKVAFNEVMGNV